jgi:hypothetical protein
MNLFRGILYIAAGVFAIYEGWVVQTHPTHASHWPFWVFYAIGVLAIGLGVWRLMQKPPKPLV